MTGRGDIPSRAVFPRPLDRLRAPVSVQEIVARLERAGFETWCVGGAVRDALLGEEHLDWDLATAATPRQVASVFQRTVPLGVEFGTVGVVVQGNVMHEVTTFRRDVRSDGRHAVVEFGASLDEDLARRDFTVNAIAFHPQTDEVRDPFHGQVDLERGIVRAVGAPSERMREDRLRALRAIRFAARFRFHIDPATWEAIVESAPHLTRLSPERVRQELRKTMEQVERPSVALEWWRSAGALRSLVPAIADAPGVRFEALDHLPRAVTAGSVAGKGGGGTPGPTLSRLSMLFFGESGAAATIATKALRFSNAESNWIAHLAQAQHDLRDAIDSALESGTTPEPRRVRQWVARIGRTRADAFFALYEALWQAKLDRVPDALIASRLQGLVGVATEIAFRDPLDVADLAVDGEDLMSTGIPAGPTVGLILGRLIDDVLDDPARNTREHLLALAERLSRTIKR